jgi:hypothetical protein
MWKEEVQDGLWRPCAIALAYLLFRQPAAGPCLSFHLLHEERKSLKGKDNQPGQSAQEPLGTEGSTWLLSIQGSWPVRAGQILQDKCTFSSSMWVSMARLLQLSIILRNQSQEA